MFHDWTSASKTLKDCRLFWTIKQTLQLWWETAEWIFEREKIEILQDIGAFYKSFTKGRIVLRFHNCMQNWNSGKWGGGGGERPALVPMLLCHSWIGIIILVIKSYDKKIFLSREVLCSVGDIVIHVIVVSVAWQLNIQFSTMHEHPPLTACALAWLLNDWKTNLIELAFNVYHFMNFIPSTRFSLGWDSLQQSYAYVCQYVVANVALFYSVTSIMVTEDICKVHGEKLYNTPGLQDGKSSICWVLIMLGLGSNHTVDCISYRTWVVLKTLLDPSSSMFYGSTICWKIVISSLYLD